MTDREALRRYFTERGWTIVMDSREGQPLDPFVAIADDLARALRSVLAESGDGYDLDAARIDAAAVLAAIDAP